MSKLTDVLDQVATPADGGSSAPRAAASSDAAELEAWQSALDGGAELKTLIDAKGPPRLYIQSGEGAECTTHYRGHRCWISGAAGAKEALQILEEFSLADLEENARWHIVAAALDVAREQREVGAAAVTLDECAERVEERAQAVTGEAKRPRFTGSGAALIGEGSAAVWSRDPLAAFIVDRGGAPAFAGWAMNPVHAIVCYIDEDRAVPNSVTL